MAVNKRLLQGAAAGGLVPSEHFGVVLYEGDGTSSHSITGLNFTPDFVWIKPRSFADNHVLSDSTRGNNKSLASNNTAAEQTTLGVASFDTGGFTLPNWGNVNDSGEDFVAWCWKANGGTTSSNTDGGITSTVQANQDAGFSIIKYTATASGTQTVGHGLGVAPELIIQKKTSGSEDWYTYIPPPTIDSNYNYLVLNSTAVAGTTGSAVPTSSVFNPVSQSGDYIAYAFKSIDGFSKIGTYTGNGSTNGPIVETGFEPAFLMIKRTDSGDNWLIFDNKRSPSDPRNLALIPNSSSVEQTGNLGNGFSFLSNGFQAVSSDGGLNDNGGSYIYMAFAADPDTEAPTVAKSFSTVTYTGDGGTQSIDGLGFTPNLVWIKNRTSSGQDHILHDSIRGAGQNFNIYSSNNAAEGQYGQYGYLSSFDTDGFTVVDGLGEHANTSAKNYVAWSWKADDNEPTIYGGPAKAVYKFEDNANDVTGTYNGTANSITYATGKFNKAAVFNGSSSYVDVSYNHSNTSFSWSMWVNADSFSNSYPTVIGGMNNSTNTNNGTIWMNSTKIVIHGSTLYGEVAFSFSTSTWYHVGMVYDSVANTVKAIINGQLYTPSSTTSNTFPSQNKMRIGRADADSTAWDGKIDQVRLYKGAISDVGVAELYAETVSDNDDLTLGGPPASIVSANANAGFSIVKYTSTGVSGIKIPHGLSAAPNLILIKCISDGSTNWIVHHSSLGNSKYLTLNDNSVQDTSTNWLVPSATTFALNQTFGNANTSGRQYIAYCWHSVSGYSAFGSYAGNGTSQSINIGFQPDLLILRKYDDNQDWMIWDSVRDGNPKEARLEANNSDAEVSGTTNINFTSTGFEFTSGFYNDSGQNSIYMAFKIN